MRRAIKIGIAVVIAVPVCIAVALAAPIVNMWRWNATPKAREAKASQDERSLITALQLFRDDVGRYPHEYEGLAILVESTAHSHIEAYQTGGYIVSRISNDPWDRAYRYYLKSREGSAQAIVCSCGADGKTGGSDEARDSCRTADTPEITDQFYCDGTQIEVR